MIEPDREGKTSYCWEGTNKGPTGLLRSALMRQITMLFQIGDAITRDHVRATVNGTD